MTRLTLVTSATAEDAAEVWPVYDSVFGDHPDEGAWREAVWDRHASRDGFRLARAYDEQGLTGFGYGYTGQRGQWWTDRVAAVWPPELSAAWLGGHFELVSVGVLARARRTGIGTAVMRALTQGLPHDRWLLMTTGDPDDPARRLYARQGWAAVGPGLTEEQVVMGRRG